MLDGPGSRWAPLVTHHVVMARNVGRSMVSNNAKCLCATGYWSYMPIAKKLTDLAARSMTDDMIGGFKGADTAVKIGIVEKYVLGVNPDCL